MSLQLARTLLAFILPSRAISISNVSRSPLLIVFVSMPAASNASFLPRSQQDRNRRLRCRGTPRVSPPHQDGCRRLGNLMRALPQLQSRAPCGLWRCGMFLANCTRACTHKSGTRFRGGDFRNYLKIGQRRSTRDLFSVP
jgi:hypothetical protein